MDTVIKLFIIGCGGFAGAVLRYLVSGWVQDASGSIVFPFGTMAVNMIGCTVIGMLTYLVDIHSFFTVETRYFVLIGLLGAFTTFSTFGNETFNLLHEGRLGLAGINAGGQVFVGLVMVWAGRAIAAGVWR